MAFPRLFSYRTFVASFRADWGFLLATAGAELDPFAPDTLAARFSKRLGPEAGLRFYGPAVHTAMCTLPAELGDLIGQKPAGA